MTGPLRRHQLTSLVESIDSQVDPYARISHRQEIIAYSQQGYQNKSWPLPNDWSSIRSVDLYRIGLDGWVPLRTGVPVTEAKLVLSLAAREAVSLVPAGAKMPTAAGLNGKPEAEWASPLKCSSRLKQP